MSDQSKLGLGQIITTPQNRDAIHCAIATVMDGCRIAPGARVRIVDGKAFDSGSEMIGIVDPFLVDFVTPGQTFWLFLFPGTITSLRHEWSHPSFVDSQSTNRAVSSASEKWLREFADAVGADYCEMMDVAKSHVDGSTWPEYLIEGGRWKGQETPEEFWVHYKNVNGGDFDPSEKGGIFSYSC